MNGVDTWAERRESADRALENAARVRATSDRLPLGGWACAAAGILSAAAGLLLAPALTWAALLVNWLFWAGVAQAGVAVSAVLVLSGGRWGRVLERAAAGLAVLLPATLVLFPLLWFGRRHLFPWLVEPPHQPWWGLGGLFLRDWLTLGASTALSLAYLYYSVRPGLGSGPAAGGSPAWLTRGWRGAAIERERCRETRCRLAIAVIVAFVAGYSLLSIDLAMTPRPGFQSALLPVIYFTGALYAAVALTAALVAVWRRLPAVHEVVAESYLLDLGNLVWGLGLFFGYLWWCRYLIVWMANLPDEAAHHLQRWYVWPWGLLGWSALALAVFLPGLLLFSRTLKRNATALGAIGALGVMGVLLQRFQDLLPALVAPEALGLLAILLALGVTLGFLGFLGAAYLWLMRRIPLFPVEDEQFVEAIRLRETPI